MECVVTDANIIIDLHHGYMLESAFRLDIKFIIPDEVYEQELSKYHTELNNLNVSVVDLTEESIIDVFCIKDQYTKLSYYDCVALVLARQEQCRLLTGDKALRMAATSEDIECNGLIWLLKLMLGEEIHTVNEIKLAAKRMQRNHARLPWNELYKILEECG